MDFVFAGKSATAVVIVDLIKKASAYLDTDCMSDRLQPSRDKLYQDLQMVLDVILPNQPQDLDAWLWFLRDAVEELGDAIDEHVYYKVREKAKEREVITKHVSVMSIVGHTGVGKTTLARLVYNDWRVRDHFDLVAWVSVSANLDVAEVTRKIIEDFTGCPCQCADLDGMEQILREKLSSTKAALLVLDDVWEDKARDQLEKLFCVLKASKTRSKILLTTRTQSVQLITGCKELKLRLHELDDDENLDLFWRYAFAGQEVGAEDYLELGKIGPKLQRNLEGLPW
uniref:NB-ARC domain-containing protein n=1 Tax=Oryza barthii TaxID=65489 RepID=A0A0D3HSG8_9ORYZ